MTSGPPDDLSDAELLPRIAAGDAQALTTLFRRRQRDVFRFVLHMTAARATAEDVTQDVFLGVMRDAARYDPERATVVAWLCGIARKPLLAGWRGKVLPVTSSAASQHARCSRSHRTTPCTNRSFVANSADRPPGPLNALMQP